MADESNTTSQFVRQVLCEHMTFYSSTIQTRVSRFIRARTESNRADDLKPNRDRMVRFQFIEIEMKSESKLNR